MSNNKNVATHVDYMLLNGFDCYGRKYAFVGMENKLQTLQSVESYIGTFFSKEWVQKNVLNLTDAEIEDMQVQMNTEAGLDPDEGGVDVPQNTDGITRYPSMDGAPIPADDIGKYDGETPPKNNGEEK